MSTHPLLVIGIDGGTWQVLGPLADMGEMPNLARLRRQGAWADLLSTTPPFTAPAWASFATGVNPGRHGVLNFIHKASEPAASLRNKGQPVNSSHIQAPTIWQYLHEAGKRIATINVPLSYPLSPVGELAISGMLTPPQAAQWTHPPALAAELADYIIDLDFGRPGKALDPAELPAPVDMLTQIMHMTERRGYHALRLLQQGPWDVFTVIFTGTDRIFHHFWHYVDPSPAAAQQPLLQFLAAHIRQYFHLLDSIIGGMVRAVGSQGHVLMLSDHGFGPAARHWCHLNNWLLELGYLTLRNSGKGSMLQRLKRQTPWLRDIARRILPQEARESLRQHGHLADAIDWPTTQAWVEPLYNNVAGVFLHRQGRHAQGPVTEADAPSLLARLQTDASKLRIPGTRRPLVQAVYTRDELYHGPHTARFPDLILILDPDYAAVPTLGSSLLTPAGPLLRSGDHRPEGIFLAAGPDVRGGPLAQPPSILDIAPTFLYLADAPLPDDLDGHLISDIWQEGVLAARPPRYRSPLPVPSQASALSQDEMAAVEDRLRGLGYL